MAVWYVCQYSYDLGTMLTHHLPQGDYNQSSDIWGPDAEEFNPERWLDPKGPLKTDQVADGTWGGGLITFITGPRTCLGFRVAVLEMQMFLTELLATFKVRLFRKCVKSVRLLIL